VELLLGMVRHLLIHAEDLPFECSFQRFLDFERIAHVASSEAA
jgi:hypothetical protein